MDRALRLIGLAFLSAGIALVAAAFALPTLLGDVVMARWVLLSGFPLVGAGVVLLRRHWDAPVAGSMLAGAALIPAAIALAAGYLTAGSQTSLSDVGLTAVELPGFRVSLPAGQPVATTRRYVVGVHQQPVPGRSGRIEVRWISIGAMGDAELRGYAEALVAPAALREVLTTDIGPDPIFSGLFESDGATGISAAYCRDAGQMVLIASAVQAGRDELASFHRRLAGSLRCGKGVPLDERDVLVPSFPVSGVGYVPSSQPATFASADGSTFTFDPAIGDASSLLAERPERLAELVSASGATVDRASYQARDVDGRHYASVVATVAGAAMRITASAFYCAELELSFFGQHQGPAGLPLEPVIAALGQARCPKDGEKPVPAREAFLAACNQGQGLACFRLARGIRAKRVEAGALDPVALEAKACKLGVELACTAQGEAKP